jgi:outer membrane protein assembly factor BamB
MSLPLLRSWSRPISPDERLLFPDGVVDRYFTARGETLACEDAEGKALWKREMTFSPQWIKLHAETVLVAGTEGAACLRRKDGEVIWVHWQSRGLSGFELVAGRLYFLEDQRRLFALDAATGSVLWTRWAQASFLRWPDKPGRLRSFDAGEHVALLPDRGEVLDAASGALLGPLGTEPVVSIDPETGKQRWSASPRNRSTLNHRPIKCLALGTDSYLAIVPRNQGTTLERIDGGSWRWSTLLRARAPALVSISRDATTLYLAHENELSASRLEDGKQLWSRRLAGPSGTWRTARVGDWLLAWPIEREKIAVPVPLTWERLECLLTWNVDTTVPVGIHDTRTGALVQRLNLPGQCVSLSVNQQGKKSDDELIAVARTPKGLLIRTKSALFAYSAP